jgi:hypothetical protein
MRRSTVQWVGWVRQRADIVIDYTSAIVCIQLTLYLLSLKIYNDIILVSYVCGDELESFG